MRRQREEQERLNRLKGVNNNRQSTLLNCSSSTLNNASVLNSSSVKSNQRSLSPNHIIVRTQLTVNDLKSE